MDRAGRLAAVAGREGAGGRRRVRRAARAHRRVDRERYSGAETLLEAYRAFLSAGRTASVRSIPSSLPNHPGAAARAGPGTAGASAAPATACAAAADAIGAGLAMIREGRADVVSRAATSALAAGRRRLHPGGCPQQRPRRRKPRLAALRSPARRLRNPRGAGMVVLEERERALARGARIHARSPATAARATPATRPTPTPPARGPRAIAEALADAGLAPDDIDYVNARHLDADRGRGGGSRPGAGGARGRCGVGDQVGARHALGLAGGLEAVAALMAFKARGAAGDPEPRFEPDPEGALRPCPHPTAGARRRDRLQLLRLRRPQRVYLAFPSGMRPTQRPGATPRADAPCAVRTGVGSCPGEAHPAPLGLQLRGPDRRRLADRRHPVRRRVGRHPGRGRSSGSSTGSSSRS